MNKEKCSIEDENVDLQTNFIEYQKYILFINRSTGIDVEFECNFSKDLSKEEEKIYSENEIRQKEDGIEKLKLELDKTNLE